MSPATPAALLAETLAAARTRLAQAGVPDPGGDAARLLAHALGLAPGTPLPPGHTALPGGVAARFAEAVARREGRVPVSQITGRRAFWRHEFRVTPDVLDPRPETETLVEAALSAQFSRVLDLGTGSGCILLSLLADRDAATGIGVDTSVPALAVARANARALGLEARAGFARSDWFSAVTGRFDLIVSNPPYVTAAEHAALAPEPRLHEPRVALTPGGDGLDAYRAILAEAAGYLAPGGRLVLEIGPAQAAAVAAIAAAAGLPAPSVRADLDGRDRVLCFGPRAA